MHTPPVTIYSTPSCQGCILTRRAFEQGGLVAGRDFRVRDVTTDPAARDRVMALGHRSAPVVEHPGGSWSGFRPDENSALIRSLRDTARDAA